MYEESEVEEQEEITKVYRKSLRKHRRRRQAADDLSSSKGGNSQPKTVLSTFIEGPKPRVSKADTVRNRSKNSRDIYEGKDGRVYLRDPDNTKYQNGGFFLGECPYDDSEISVLKTKRIWKFKKTGRKGLDRFRRVVEFVKFARLLFVRFERTKVIAKEGQRAEFYYLILTGVAVSRCLDTCIQSEDRRRQVAEFHRQGDTLGEKEILTNCDRPATFVCKEPLEVLGVDREVRILTKKKILSSLRRV
ncbi:hypothetical protein FSP39_025476 [Pinctada imbricata]|uniref:Cyclic nucleotide-binding domain-containing protein n=1 Tax=Pinctada imbricata TaxID=66713 RepID=A0AA89C4B4_PINIB|nr:hypothetical protein FSP39_025476 [Pinctada imbricata]